MLNINDFAKEIHDNAVKHGWWEEERRFPEIVALCHSELSEALEEYRADRPMFWTDCNNDDPIAGCSCMEGVKQDGYTRNKLVCTKVVEDHGCHRYGKKPEGIAVEMADCIIRILDWCGKEGIDIEAILKAKHEYNKGRAYKHGGKKA